MMDDLCGFGDDNIIPAENRPAIYHELSESFVSESEDELEVIKHKECTRDDFYKLVNHEPHKYLSLALFCPKFSAVASKRFGFRVFRAGTDTGKLTIILDPTGEHEEIISSDDNTCTDAQIIELFIMHIKSSFLVLADGLLLSGKSKIKDRSDPVKTSQVQRSIPIKDKTKTKTERDNTDTLEDKIKLMGDQLGLVNNQLNFMSQQLSFLLTKFQNQSM